MTFWQWAEIYLNLEEVKKLTTYEDRKLKVSNLVEFFGDKPLSAITPEEIAAYRAQRVQYKRICCEKCQRPLRGQSAEAVAGGDRMPRCRSQCKRSIMTTRL